MANTKLSEKGIGEIVKVRENGNLVDYVVARKNYEESLNPSLAKDWTLLVRREPLTDRVAWATGVDSTTDLDWWSNNCRLRAWLENTWFARLNEAAQNAILPIHYLVNDVTNRSTGKVFVLAKRDLEDAGWANVWEKLSYNGWEWLREHSDSEKEDGDDMVNWWYTRVYIARQTNGQWQVTDSGFPNAEYDNMAVVRPCFAAGAGARVDETGELVNRSAPTISSDHADSGDLGAKDAPFSVRYQFADADGDTLTVTELISGTTLRSWTSSGGGSGTLTLTDAVWQQLEDDQYYDLVVRVTDGEFTTEWTTRFLKTKKRGYRVYAGTLADTVNGQAIAPGSYRFDTLQCIYDPTLGDMSEMILDPEVNLQKNDAGTFEFTLPCTNIWYDRFTPKKTAILIEEDGAELWTGYVTELSRNFKMEKTVQCKGELGYLKDISMRLEAREWTVSELCEAIVKATQGAGIKSFRLGKISDGYRDEKVSTKDSGAQYTTVWDVIENTLLSTVGGMVRLRKRRDKTANYGVGYTRYLDFLSDVEDRTDQTIEFGQNLLDFEYDIQADEIVNRVKVYGYETSGFWFWSKTSQICEVVEDAESIAKYGVCERCMLVEGTSSTKDSLRVAGDKYLNENGVGVTASFTVNALDLRDAGVDVGRLCFMKKTHVISKVHNIDDWQLCSALRIPLDSPEDKEFTFGETVDSFTKKQMKTSTVARRAMDTVNSVIGYVSSGR